LMLLGNRPVEYEDNLLVSTEIYKKFQLNDKNLLPQNLICREIIFFEWKKGPRNATRITKMYLQPHVKGGIPKAMPIWVLFQILNKNLEKVNKLEK